MVTKPLVALERAENAGKAILAALAGIEAYRQADMAAPELDQATDDWAANRLYLLGNNWRLKTKSGRGPIAPYNQTLKAAEITPDDLDIRGKVIRVRQTEKQ